MNRNWSFVFRMFCVLALFVFSRVFVCFHLLPSFCFLGLIVPSSTKCANWRNLWKKNTWEKQRDKSTQGRKKNNDPLSAYLNQQGRQLQRKMFKVAQTVRHIDISHLRRCGRNQGFSWIMLVGLYTPLYRSGKRSKYWSAHSRPSRKFENHGPIALLIIQMSLSMGCQ